MQVLAVGSRSRSEPPLWMQNAGYSSCKTAGARAVTKHSLQGACQTRTDATAVLVCPLGDTRFLTALKLGSKFLPNIVSGLQALKGQKQREYMEHRVLLVKRPLKLLSFCLLKISLKF